MARIVIVGPSQPARTPRLVRNADALAAVGHEVIVVTPRFELSVAAYDSAITDRSAWTYQPIDLLDSSERLAVSHRLKRKIAGSILRKLPVPRFSSLGLMYGANQLKSVLLSISADLYIAQQQAALPVVASVAGAHQKPFGCDIEDILTESTDEPRELIRAIEATYLPRASVVSTMSEAAAAYLTTAYSLRSPVLPLHNCSSLGERFSLESPKTRTEGKTPCIYWFGQTLGPHSLAVELIRANAEAGNEFSIALRGRPQGSYLQAINEAARLYAAESLVTILPMADPFTMVEKAAEHDILFASQPSQQLFHQLAIGNKVFTGLMAGCAIVATDTVAHRVLHRSIPNAMTLFGNQPETSLAARLAQFARSRKGLLAAREAAWEAGTSVFNWETEAMDWKHKIERAIRP